MSSAFKRRSIQMNAQQVYDYLRKTLGREIAYDLMESLEGDDEGYERLKSMIVSGEFENNSSE
jgi:hypothetical protein